jgi:hypothetical protein
VRAEDLPGASASATGRWHDTLTVGQLAIVAMLAAVNAWTGWEFQVSNRLLRGWVEGHIGLHGALVPAYIFAVDLATGILMLFVLAAVVHSEPRHGARQYVLLALGLALAAGVGTFVSYANATQWTFALDRIFPHGYFEPFRGNAAAEAILYTSTNRLSFVWSYWFYPATLGFILASAYLYFRAQAAVADALAASRVETERAVEQAAEARLQMLEAQIEPHFLFNTLANVKRLYQTEPATGRQMLDNLLRYLQEALPRMREGNPTLGRDIALTHAYLGVQQIRMGERLAYTIDVPDELRSVPLPPMVVLTLVENAIKHGLNPLPRGGSLAVSAHRDGSRVVIRVADTGRGFTKSSGGGTGLANVRARLALAFGGRACLRLGNNVPSGIVASVELDTRAEAGPAKRAAEVVV